MSKTDASNLMKQWAARVNAFIMEGDGSSEARKYADRMLAHFETLAKGGGR